MTTATAQPVRGEQSIHVGVVYGMNMIFIIYGSYKNLSYYNACALLNVIIVSFWL